MSYPIIPLVGFWNNQIQYTPKFTLIQASEGGVIDRSRSQLINAVRRSWSVSAVITNQGELDGFLRDRDGLPFEYRPDGLTPDGNYTCIDWTFGWKVFVAPNGVWDFQATFIEDFNP
ncbi:hypothetical protein Lepto7375DRAFT_7237 [Leptolyngbya sp. PCC 7375]|nr:hypothetical protein Lepto7375DRAFT_7237 [Leptolyngbya sp. PCC 7375]